MVTAIACNIVWEVEEVEHDGMLFDVLENKLVGFICGTRPARTLQNYIWLEGLE